MRIETIGEATLILADCQEWLASLPDCFRVDAVVTDPPYGVEFQGKSTKHTKRNADGYASTSDDEKTMSMVLRVVDRCLELAERAIVTPGTRICFSYPKPAEIGSIYFPSGAGYGRWGFISSQPILYYGKCPYLKTGQGHRPNSFEFVGTAEESRHPCAKPIRIMEWLVKKASLPGETVLDPFMGSGTTGIACANLGRKFIGIEIEPKYFDLSCERISAAQSQGRLFAEQL